MAGLHNGERWVGGGAALQHLIKVNGSWTAYHANFVKNYHEDDEENMSQKFVSTHQKRKFQVVK